MKEFKDIVRKYGKNLEKLGYEYVEISEYLIAYKKALVKLVFYYDSYAFEINCSIYYEKHNVSIDEMMSALNIRKRGLYQICKSSELEKGVAHISSCLEKYCLQIIEQSDLLQDCFDIIEKKRAMAEAEDSLKSDFLKAEHLWAKKDFQSVKGIYIKHKKHLSKLQKMRLEWILKNS